MIFKVFSSNDEIKVFIERNYDIKVNSIEKMKVRTADLYNINNCEYVLKHFKINIFQKKILLDVEVFRMPRRSWINVHEYVKTTTGEYEWLYGRIIKIIPINVYLVQFSIQLNNT